jgi:hypothetical protein
VRAALDAAQNRQARATELTLSVGSATEPIRAAVRVLLAMVHLVALTIHATKTDMAGIGKPIAATGRKQAARGDIAGPGARVAGAHRARRIDLEALAAGIAGTENLVAAGAVCIADALLAWQRHALAATIVAIAIGDKGTGTVLTADRSEALVGNRVISAAGVLARTVERRRTGSVTVADPGMAFVDTLGVRATIDAIVAIVVDRDQADTARLARRALAFDQAFAVIDDTCAVEAALAAKALLLIVHTGAVAAGLAAGAFGLIVDTDIADTAFAARAFGVRTAAAFGNARVARAAFGRIALTAKRRPARIGTAGGRAAAFGAATGVLVATAAEVVRFAVGARIGTAGFFGGAGSEATGAVAAFAVGRTDAGGIAAVAAAFGEAAWANADAVAGDLSSRADDGSGGGRRAASRRFGGPFGDAARRDCTAKSQQPLEHRATAGSRSQRLHERIEPTIVQPQTSAQVSETTRSYQAGGKKKAEMLIEW